MIHEFLWRHLDLKLWIRTTKAVVDYNRVLLNIRPLFSQLNIKWVGSKKQEVQKS